MRYIWVEHSFELGFMTFLEVEKETYKKLRKFLSGNEMESNENDTNQVKKNYEMKPKGTN